MFFETNQVNDALICINCEGRLEEPKMLPCGETICSFCVSSFNIVDKMFDCVLCKQKHDMPKNGLPNNKRVNIKTPTNRQIKIFTISISSDREFFFYNML